MTRTGVARIMRFAYELARSRPRRLLTIVTKSNAQRHAMVMWDEIATEVGREIPEVTTDRMLVDAMNPPLVLKPPSIDPRTEERRDGKESRSTCRSRMPPDT